VGVLESGGKIAMSYSRTIEDFLKPSETEHSDLI
jgi:hypothetical protein